MYAANFAAGLAVKSRAPPGFHLGRSLIGAFWPDFLRIALGLAGIEPSPGLFR
jgi:hypothetical protein